MELKTLLAELGSQLGIDSFQLNENGVASLQFDNRVEVHFEPSPDGKSLLMYAPICRWPDRETDQAALAAMLLDANFFGRGTGGAMFSLDAHESEIVLERAFALSSVAAADVYQQLTRLLDVIDRWLDRLASGTDAQQISSSTEGNDWMGLRV